MLGIHACSKRESSKEYPNASADLNVFNISADKATIEVQVSEQGDLDESSEYVVASVTLPNPDQARTVGKLQLDAVHAAISLIEQAATEIERELTR
jgi:hypothetical protein